MLKEFVQKLFKFIYQNEKVWTIMAIHFAFWVLTIVLPHKASGSLPSAPFLYKSRLVAHLLVSNSPCPSVFTCK
jgi:hypothetical protein